MSGDRAYRRHRYRFLVVQLTVLLWVLVALSLFFVPSVERLWDEANQPLPEAVTPVFAVSRWQGGRLSANQSVPGFVWIAPFLLLATVAAFWWWLRGWRTAGAATAYRCLRCGYDLRGSLAGGATFCPECGYVFDRAIYLGPREGRESH